MANVIYGDCLEVVPTLGKFDFVFADPPFNIGMEYSGYKDNRTDFNEWLACIVATLWKATSGVLCLHGPDKLADVYIQTAAQLGFLDRRIAWLNWHYRFGVCQRNRWIDTRCHCLVFAKSQPHTWNPDAVLVPSDRATTYADKRIEETANGGLRLPGTVWGVPSDGEGWGRVQGNNRERVKVSPNQLPEKYLERLLLAYTNTGDTVLDPFAGSGTTAVVAEALGRQATTIDISADNIKAVRQRLAKGACRVAKIGGAA